VKHLYFVRHGESEFNKAHKWTGSTDSPLTEEGHVQAKNTGDEIKKTGVKIDAIISSPLTRAHQTAVDIAEVIGYPVNEITQTDLLVERNFGELEGQKDWLQATQYLLDESSIDKHEGVETLAALQRRADTLLEKLIGLDKDSILIVGHGAIGRALKRAINKKPLRHRGSSFKNGELVQLI
jgi:broad specificity phosphatase PhoE